MGPRVASFALLCLVFACEDSTATSTEVVFDPSARGMFDLPFPSDLRRLDDGHLDLSGWPTRGNVILGNLMTAAKDRIGWSVMPVAYFRFTRPIAARDLDAVVPARADSPLLLVDIDATSPERGRLVPLVAKTLSKDDYVPEHVLAVAPRPGFVLSPNRMYAFVVLRSLRDANGADLGISHGFAQVSDSAAFRPLWDTLGSLAVKRDAVAAATVFTTGDVVAETARMSDGLVARSAVAVTNLRVDPDDGATHARFCELIGEIALPQFQTGQPPFATDGRFVAGADGLPVAQREERIPLTITIPKAPMPPDGFPLVMYFHGSGGDSKQVADRGAPSEPSQGYGPAHVLAPFGFAMASSALPISPERVPGAGDFDYLNFNNLSAFPFTVQQGIIEQRLLIRALGELRIASDVVAPCNLPQPGEIRLDLSRLTAMGQSMGGMYTNLIGPTEPRILGVVPTGAGGFWSLFITKTSKIQGAQDLITALLRIKPEDLTFVHPSLHLMQLAFEPAEPLAHVPRLAREPLAGHPARPIYEPVGQNDSYFPSEIYDAMALGYGNAEAGDIVWQSMRDALALDGRAALAEYPVANNRSSVSGRTYTGVVAQFAGDGVHDTHAIFVQLEEVKHQYGCFFDTLIHEGVAIVPEPDSVSAPCMHAGQRLR